jgi:urease accessory protein
MLNAVVVNMSGGLVGGDLLELRLTLGAKAEALVTTQAAEKLYRSTGADCRVRMDVTVGENAWLEWLPQETIIFDGARLRQRTALRVAGTARALAGEVLVFGRVARGEHLTHGLIHDEWQVYRENRLVWADSLHLDGDLAAKLASPAGFRGNKAAATFIYAGQDAQQWLESARRLIDQDKTEPPFIHKWTGISCIGSLLVARWLGNDAAVVRRSYGTFWKGFRSMVGNLPPSLPTIWDI